MRNSEELLKETFDLDLHLLTHVLAVLLKLAHDVFKRVVKVHTFPIGSV